MKKYRNDDIHVVSDYIRKDDYLVSVDIKNGFYHVLVHRDDRLNGKALIVFMSPRSVCVHPLTILVRFYDL